MGETLPPRYAIHTDQIWDSTMSARVTRQNALGSVTYIPPWSVRIVELRPVPFFSFFPSARSAMMLESFVYKDVAIKSGYYIISIALLSSYSFLPFTLFLRIKSNVKLHFAFTFQPVSRRGKLYIQAPSCCYGRVLSFASFLPFWAK